MVAKIEWHRSELFPRIGFVVTNSRLPADKVIKVYNGRGIVENRIKEGKNTLRWDKTSCQRFEATQRCQTGRKPAPTPRTGRVRVNSREMMHLESATLA